MTIKDFDVLEKELISMYQAYFRKRRKMGAPADVNGIYMTGKLDGSLDVIGAIYLACFGGKKMMDLWQFSLPEGEDDGYMD